MPRAGNRSRRAGKVGAPIHLARRDGLPPSRIHRHRGVGSSVRGKRMRTMPYQTKFGSLEHYEKGGIEVINDDPRNYVFSNVYEVASKAEPYEKIAVGKNLKYVLEAVRAEGTSPWYTASHDEAAIIMDGEVEIRLVKLNKALVAENHEGTTMLEGN